LAVKAKQKGHRESIEIQLDWKVDPRAPELADRSIGPGEGRSKD
jgi:hypothetical protein